MLWQFTGHLSLVVFTLFGGYRLESQLTGSLDWNDTFLNIEHLKSSFPGYAVHVKSSNPAAEPWPPFRWTFISLRNNKHLLAVSVISDTAVMLPSFHRLTASLSAGDVQKPQDKLCLLNHKPPRILAGWRQVSLAVSEGFDVLLEYWTIMMVSWKISL